MRLISKQSLFSVFPNTYFMLGDQRCSTLRNAIADKQSQSCGGDVKVACAQVAVRKYVSIAVAWAFIPNYAR